MVNEFGTEELTPKQEEEIVEQDAKYWSGRVVDIIEQTGEEVDTPAAIETLAVLDAEHSITDQYDPDEMDLFLDEFEEAVEDHEKKEDILDEHLKDAKKGDKEDTKEEKE